MVLCYDYDSYILYKNNNIEKKIYFLEIKHFYEKLEKIEPK